MAKGMISKKYAIASIGEEILFVKHDMASRPTVPSSIEKAANKHFIRGLRTAMTIIRDLPTA